MNECIKILNETPLLIVGSLIIIGWTLLIIKAIFLWKKGDDDNVDDV